MSTRNSLNLRHKSLGWGTR